MREHGFHNSVDVSTPPAPPNFDDEVTVLRARPVVPLEAISRIRRRRRWMLGGAFAVAMMLGAASALIASYIRLRSVPEPASEVSEVEIDPAPMAVAEPVVNDSSVEENLEGSALPVTPRRSSTVKPRTDIRPVSDSSHSRGERRLSEEEELRRIRDAVLVDQWQERRQRRVERRDRRNGDNGGGRDLSNLDEIFEGPRRP